MTGGGTRVSAVHLSSTFKSRGSILKDANTSGGQAEAHTGGLQQPRIPQAPSAASQGRTPVFRGFSECLWRNTDNALIVLNCPGVEREMGGWASGAPRRPL